MSWDSEAETLEPHARDMDRMRQGFHQNRILRQIAGERDRQDARWGVQHHPDGTADNETNRALRDLYRNVCDAQAADPSTDSWLNILREETFEAFAEEDRVSLRKELVQCAAVIVAWIEDIDGRG